LDRYLILVEEEQEESTEENSELQAGKEITENLDQECNRREYPLMIYFTLSHEFMHKYLSVI